MSPSRRHFLQSTLLASITPTSLLSANKQLATASSLSGCQLLPGARFYVGIDGHGLWPNLTKLPNGEIAAAVYNHPSHGYGDASDVDLWVSTDGVSWNFRSKISSHPEVPNGIRMNHAVGLNADGHLIALVSGYQPRQKLPMLKLQRCISKDNGQTWERALLDLPGVPHGDIFALPDGRLVCPTYRRISNAPVRRRRASVIFSHDGGKTWDDEQPTADQVSESFILRKPDGEWLAVCRSAVIDGMDRAVPHGAGETLIRSQDEGKSWTAPKLLSPQGQENAHLLQLNDGRILCSFTSRIPGLFGVVMRMSENGGDTWSLPVVLITAPLRDWRKTDCGYPSSVQLDDDSIVTAYYFGPKKPEWAAHGLPWHQRYHMGVAKWNLSCWPTDD